MQIKKKYVLLEFLIAFIFVALQPLISSFYAYSKNISAAMIFRLSPYLFIGLAESILLELQFIYFPIKSRKESVNRENTVMPAENSGLIKADEDNIHLSEKESLKQRRFRWFFITFLSLLAVEFIISASTVIISQGLVETIFIDFPSTSSHWLIMVFQLAVQAFCEEEFYRQFFPEALLYITDSDITDSSKNRKLIAFICEISIVLIFAFSHLYSGWLAVLNAFISGIVLRLCWKHTGSIWTGWTAHFLYNLVTVLIAHLLT